jgi:hypothetical protein
MKKTLAFALAAAALVAVPAPASALTVEGITYNLFETSISNGGLTGNFVLVISGVNSASDTRGGRDGINAFALTDPTVGDAVSGTVTAPAGFDFQFGGLNSSGCNTSQANFFCFANTGAVFDDPLGPFIALVFSVTSDTVGSWENYAPSFKIDWSGTENNYDLVSQPIPVTNGPCIGAGCPTPTPQAAVPEPATWAMMLLGFGATGFAMRRKRRETRHLAQIA